MKDAVLGNHLWCAREGEVIDGITVAFDAKPDTTPESNYIKFPTIEDWEPKIIPGNKVIRRAPSPGQYQDRKTFNLGQRIQYAFSLQEWNEMTFAEMLLGGNKPVAGVFVPGQRTELFRAWWIVQGYNAADEDKRIVSLNVWGEAAIESYKFGEKVDPYAMVITQLYSPFNTGLVENLS